MTKLRRRFLLCAWISALAFSAWIAFAHTRIFTDLTGFLPTAPDRTQQLLLDQLRDGPASRLILLAIEGDTPQHLADASHALTETLRQDKRLAFVHNGELDTLGVERDILTRYRYLLSPAVSAEHFQAPALKESLQKSAELLQSSAGVLLKPLIPLDPTGEVPRIAALWTPASTIKMQEGVWFSADSKRALLITQTNASGMDAVQQQEIISALQQHFLAIQKTFPAAKEGSLRLLMSGTPVFAAESRQIIERDSWRLSLVAASLVLVVLLVVYRSLSMTVLAFVPVAAGLLVGVAVVSLVFGGVHGITLAFAATLIGETVDYPNYAFLHTARGEAVKNALQRIGPTLRLAVLTTVLSSTALLFSSFSGLSQLGLLSLVGVAVAGITTQFILPVLAGANVTTRKIEALPFKLAPGNSLRHAVLPLLLLALAGIAWQHDKIWNDDLGSLSPVSEQAKALDQQLRSQLGAPDIRHILMTSGKDTEQALRNSELLQDDLQQIVKDGIIGGFDMAARYLPSQELQRQRQAALPDAENLQNQLQQAMTGSAFREDAFLPFLHDVQASKQQALLRMEDLRGSSIGLKVQSLLLHDNQGAVALITLSGVTDSERLRKAIAGLQAKGVTAIDLKDDTSHLINGYRNQSLILSGVGILLIALLLLLSLSSIRDTVRVLYPVLTGTVICVALTILRGEKLTLFHLVALLLVIGIGLNYALFFNRHEHSADDTRRNHLSLLVCSLTTFLSFGTLMLSRIPVLHAIGQTVALGSLLCLICACLLAKRNP
ncbi:MMPL family transporter [Undibacterium sp.]|jgi:predicted exporter|uniref:MMPL family transporter n=1 Tax=Undibacterium sp. TaxID=1914977 RepID=UPI002CFDB8AF|nr:MMPL family transporter [Undibacterium sp.]HTD06377.1 MMPL family transporter [Undibacterium sp.]